MSTLRCFLNQKIRINCRLKWKFTILNIKWHSNVINCFISCLHALPFISLVKWNSTGEKKWKFEWKFMVGTLLIIYQFYLSPHTLSLWILNLCISNTFTYTFKHLQFEGQEIKLDSKVGIFITMNPGMCAAVDCKITWWHHTVNNISGYAGRTELPESIKALFRPVTCIMPDLELICLISLFSDGFLTAKVLAKKMTVLYKLAREQLSKQFHYDWGLRSLNSVLRMAGMCVYFIVLPCVVLFSFARIFLWQI